MKGQQGFEEVMKLLKENKSTELAEELMRIKQNQIGTFLLQSFNVFS